MPHQCTNCERVFPDGSKEMLSGCPDCGGNKFQFKPDSATPTPTLGDDTSVTDEAADASSGPADTPATADSASSSPTDTATPPPDDTSPTDSTPSPDRSDAEASGRPRPADTDTDYIEAESDPSVLEEDTAQADARRDVVTRDELDAASSPPSSADDAAQAIPPDASNADDSPDIADLRAELNDQFESIKILEPGQYELNLMELYDRQECIISLQEDGHYVIEVVDTWRDDDS
jgi:predicted  nucleic acid-binding Zn-ribbon protein